MIRGREQETDPKLIEVQRASEREKNAVKNAESASLERDSGRTRWTSVGRDFFGNIVEEVTVVAERGKVIKVGVSIAEPSKGV